MTWRGRMAKKAKRRSTKRVAWTRAHMAELRRYSKDKMQVRKISRLMKRTVAALRQKARALGIRLGHRRGAAWGHQRDIPSGSSCVRFTPESGHVRCKH